MIWIFMLIPLIEWKPFYTWKLGLEMDDPYYLPVPPLFFNIKDNQYYDVLTDNMEISTAYNGSSAVYNLSKRINVSETLKNIKIKCKESNWQACLLYSRIFEFGSYNQTQNMTKAEKYILKSNAPLGKSLFFAFKHRHYSPDYAMSVTEDFLEDDAIETQLTIAYHYFRGILLPLTEKKAYKMLIKIATDIAKMYTYDFYPIDHKISFTNNSDYKNNIKYCAWKMSLPYFSLIEAINVSAILREANKKGYKEAASYLIMLQFEGYDGYYVEEAKELIPTGVDLNDPKALYMASLVSASSKTNTYKMALSKLYLKQSVEGGYPKAIRRYAWCHENGYLNVPMNKKKAFELYKHAAELGELSACISAAKIIFNDRPSNTPSSSAFDYLFQVTRNHPIYSFLNKYANIGSKHAFWKMIDMGMIPSTMLENTDLNEYEKLMIDSIQYPKEILENRIRTEMGDVASIVWMSLHSRLNESLYQIERLQYYPPSIKLFQKPLKFIILCKSWYGRIKGNLTLEESAYLYEISIPIFHFLIVVIMVLLLFILVSKRINMIVEYRLKRKIE